MNTKKLKIIAISAISLLVATTVLSVVLAVILLKPKPLGWQYELEITNVGYSITQNAEDSDYIDFTVTADVKNTGTATSYIGISLLLYGPFNYIENDYITMQLAYNDRLENNTKKTLTNAYTIPYSWIIDRENLQLGLSGIYVYRYV